jgi:hypothetical protein
MRKHRREGMDERSPKGRGNEDGDARQVETAENRNTAIAMATASQLAAVNRSSEPYSLTIALMMLTVL